MGIIKKTCNKCKVYKNVTQFHKSRKGDGYQYTCKPCKASLGRKYQQINQFKNPTRNREAGLKRRYNLTIPEYNQMLTLQSGVCDICGSEDPKNGKENLCVDHDHKTGKVRGLLCGPCNRALGCLYDDIDSLKRAIKYLEKHNAD